MQYYGTRLSENISKREPEGYLLCLNVPVARTGYQEYLPEELGIDIPPGSWPEGAEGVVQGAIGKPPVKVFRPEEEVFSKETIASFEGMPVTNDHPPDGVDIENIRRLQTGHAHNVRRGTGEESDLLLADLIITDPRLIDQILAGKREISCGYTYDLFLENGQYIQRKIRGNHIAVVDAGRAGHRVSIKDSQAETSARKERSKNPMTKNLTNWLKKKAKDGDMETVAEFIEEVIGESSEETEITVPAAPEETIVMEVPENREITIDEESVSGILSRLDQLIALLTEVLHPAVTDEEPLNAGSTGACAEELAEAVEEVIEAAEAENAENTPAAEIAEMVESVLEEEVSTTSEEDECEEEREEQDARMSRDALRAALSAVRPALAAMTPKQRRKACGAIASRLNPPRKGKDTGIYAALAKAARKPEPDYSDLGKRIMEKRNPHYRK